MRYSKSKYSKHADPSDPHVSFKSLKLKKFDVTACLKNNLGTIHYTPFFVAYDGGGTMVLSYKRSQLKQKEEIKHAEKVDFSKISNKKRYEINKLLVRITTL